VKKLLLSLFFPLLLVSSDSLILQNESIIMDKAIPKLDEMAGELRSKTGINVYIIARKTLSGESITDYTKKESETQKGSFLLLVIAADDHQIDMGMSADVATIIDKDEILDDYIIPILVEKRKDISLQQQYSAAVFNGMAEAMDQLAASQNIVLESSVGNGSKDFFDGLTVVIKILLLLTGAALFYAYYQNKKSKGNA